VLTALLALAHAAVPVTLPRGQDPLLWEQPLALADLAPGEPGNGPWVILAEAETGDWWMVVRRADGSVERVGVDRPDSGTDRETLAFLAASLLEPVVTVAVVSEPSPEPPPPPVRRVAQKPPPTEVAPPQPPSELPPPDPPPPEPKAWLALDAVPGAQVGGGVGAVPVLGADLEVQIGGLWVASLWGVRPMTTELVVAEGIQQVSRTDYGASVGLASRSDVRLTMGLGRSHRRIETDAAPSSVGALPMVRADLRWVWPGDSALAVVPSAWLTADLSPTLIVVAGNVEQTPSVMGGGLAVAVRRTWSLSETPW
jgi:hypothetical protein